MESYGLGVPVKIFQLSPTRLEGMERFLLHLNNQHTFLSPTRLEGMESKWALA